MPREKEAYRDNLERINNFHPNGELLNIGDVMKFTGLGYKAVKNTFKFTTQGKYISKATLARALS